MGRVVLGLFGILVSCSRRRDWWSMHCRKDAHVGPVCVVTVQVALMSEVARARAAVDAHVGVLGVAQAWLGFLHWLSSVAANIAGLRGADVKPLVTAALSHHPVLLLNSWTQDLVKRL